MHRTNRISGTIGTVNPIHRRLGVLSAAAVATIAMNAGAATLDWDADPDTAGIQAGPGTWHAANPAANTWRNGASQVAWTNGNDARFDTAAVSNVAISGAVEVVQLQNMNGGLLTLDTGSSLSSSSLFYVGSGADAAGAFYQKNGSVSVANGSNLRIGSNNGYGFYGLAGGTMTIGTGTAYIGRTPTTGTAGVGVLYQTGGAITTSANLEMSNSSSGNSHSVYYISGGSYTTSQSGISLAQSAANTTSQLTITNATVGATLAAGTASVTLGAGTLDNQVAVLNLNSGGVLQMSRIVSNNAPGTGTVRHLNFNGGTVRTLVTGNDSVQTNPFLDATQLVTAVNVYAGGATFDVVNSGGFTTMGHALVAPAGDGVAGTEIAVANGGSGYLGAPVVKIDGVTGATAVAKMIEDGSGTGTFKVEKIIITSPGINATGTPTYSFIGGGATTPALGGQLTTAANTSGGLTKIGDGSLRLSGANTYTGATIIDDGTLILQATGDLSFSSGVTVRTGAVFDASAKTGAVVKGLKGAGQVSSRNDGTVANRLLVQNLLAPGDNGVGTLTIANGDLRVGDGAIYEYEIGGTTASPVSDLIDITRASSEGDLTFDGDWTLKLLNVGSVDPTDKEFVLFDYTSGAHPNWAGLTIDLTGTNWAGGSVWIDTTNRRVMLSDLEVVPEPSALALIGLAALPMVRRRRR